jgi:hypothetical protein
VGEEPPARPRGRTLEEERSAAYSRLAREQSREGLARDWSRAWDRLVPLAEASEEVRMRVEQFAAGKRISLAALDALGTRIAIRKGGGVWLAWAGRNPAGDAVTAIKYRPLGGGSHDCEAEKPSVWLLPIVLGRRDSLDWFVAEGETDGARLYELAGAGSRARAPCGCSHLQAAVGRHDPARRDSGPCTRRRRGRRPRRRGRRPRDRWPDAAPTAAHRGR